MDTKTPFSSPVKEYSVESYICDESGKPLLDSSTTWKYNRNHQISEIDQQSPNKELSEMSYYTYDNDGYLKEIVTKVAEGEQKRLLIYEYKDNQLDQVIEISGDYKTVTRYDDHGNPSEKLTYTQGDLLISTTLFVNLYDQEGRLVEKHSILPSGDEDWINNFQYNEAGQLVEEQKTRNQFVTTSKHSYNEKGDLVLSEFNPGEFNHETLKREIVYDRNNDIMEIKEYRKGWCYQDHNEEFGLTGITRYSYVR
jgi:hypothetical protein